MSDTLIDKKVFLVRKRDSKKFLTMGNMFEQPRESILLRYFSTYDEAKEFLTNDSVIVKGYIRVVAHPSDDEQQRAKKMVLDMLNSQKPNN